MKISAYIDKENRQVTISLDDYSRLLGFLEGAFQVETRTVEKLEAVDNPFVEQGWRTVQGSEVSWRETSREIDGE